MKQTKLYILVLAVVVQTAGCDTGGHEARRVAAYSDAQTDVWLRAEFSRLQRKQRVTALWTRGDWDFMPEEYSPTIEWFSYFPQLR